MTVPTMTPSAPRDAISVRRLVVLHLAPGIPLTLFAVACAPLLLAAHLPVIWGLLAGVLIVQVPLLEMLRRRIGATPRPSRPRHPSVVVVFTIVAAFLLPGLVVWFEPFLRGTVFGFVPPWWSLSPAGDSPVVWAVTITLWIAAPVIAGPICEERYFRGALIGRLPGGAWTSAFLGAGLFSAYHLWQPWAVLTVFAFSLPLCIARTRFGLGIVGCSIVHCVVNAATLAVLIAGLER